MQHEETFKKIKNALKTGDQRKIAKRTGLSYVWINQTLNLKNKGASEETQKLIIDASLKVIKGRLEKEAKESKKYAEKAAALLE